MFANPMMSGGGEAPPSGGGGFPTDDGQLIDLDTKIDTQGCYARNAAAGSPLTNLFIGDTRLGCKSDTDEQLILHIAFHEFVKIKTIKLTHFNNGQDPELNPSKVHLYVNRKNFGFEDTDDIEPTQTLQITSEDLRESSEPIVLKYVKFQGVKSLSLFIEENQGGEQTALGGLKLFGRPESNTKMADLKKQPTQA